jgi:GH35 family endo-1,4-beta-xylanase
MEVMKNMKILYKSLFRGWVEITEEQKQQLIKHMNNGITALSGEYKQKYIKSRFIEK